MHSLPQPLTCLPCTSQVTHLSWILGSESGKSKDLPNPGKAGKSSPRQRLVSNSWTDCSCFPPNLQQYLLWALLRTLHPTPTAPLLWQPPGPPRSNPGSLELLQISSSWGHTNQRWDWDQVGKSSFPRMGGSEIQVMGSSNGPRDESTFMHSMTNLLMHPLIAFCTPIL